MDGYQELLKSLEPQHTIVTPNRRMAATLHKIHAQLQIETGLSTWPTPTILPLHAWLQKLWQNLLANAFIPLPHLMTTTQERYVWEQILLKTDHPLLRIHETAKLVQSAWQLLNQFLIDYHHPSFNSAPEYQALAHWISTYCKHCKEKKLIDFARLPAYLCQEADRIFDLPNQLILLGFSEITPELQCLLNICREKGVTLNFPQVNSQIKNETRTTLQQSEDEIYAMARWSKAIRDENPNKKVACVIPQLDKIRNRVQQIFAEVFSENNFYDTAPVSAHFNISAGVSLSDYPIIRIALLILQLPTAPISLTVFSQLLSTAFLGEAELELNQRATLDFFLHKNNYPVIDMGDPATRNLIEQKTPELAKRLLKFFNYYAQLPKFQSHQAWAISFQRLLTILCWPGERVLNSQEYQTMEAWFKTLNDFAKLDIVDASTSGVSAFEQLKRNLCEQKFQTESPEANINILGVLEAVGLPFDYLWLSGMDDTAWPPSPEPHPYIPKSLQRELDMPHATALRELKYCSQLLQQFRIHNREIIYSFAEKDNDIEHNPSSLILAIPFISHENLKLSDYVSVHDIIYNSKALEKILDDTGAPINLFEKVPGGINIIKQQAQCPFKAYAEWRLYAQEMDPVAGGLRPKDRGTLIHKILEIIWSKLQKQERLLASSEKELQTLLLESIDQTFLALRQSLLKTHYIHLEKKRLFKILFNWLNLEKQRSAFEVIAFERKEALKINNLNLHIKIDRIDELSDGTKVIIDYKTGKYNDINSWIDERPDEPQLPLYLLLSEKDSNISSIAFAQLSTGDLCFKGISRDNIDVKGIRAINEIKKMSELKWEEHLDRWKNIFTQLADDFTQGIASVDPKEGDVTCKRCALEGFCRIYAEAID